MLVALRSAREMSVVLRFMEDGTLRASARDPLDSNSVHTAYAGNVDVATALVQAISELMEQMEASRRRGELHVVQSYADGCRT